VCSYGGRYGIPYNKKTVGIMARKRRDYRAEYARRKAAAKAKGYSGPREEYRARKALGFTKAFRRSPTLPKAELPDFAIARLSTDSEMSRLRREAKEWSAGHSWVKASRYRGNMSNAQVRAYHHAYVERVTVGSRRGRAKEKRLRIYEYLTTYGYPVEGGPENWKSDLAPA